jgi:hypothetical protein
MRLAFMFLALTMGLVGCAQSDSSQRLPPGAPSADSAYDEGQRSQDLEGNTR